MLRALCGELFVKLWADCIRNLLSSPTIDLGTGVLSVNAWLHQLYPASSGEWSPGAAQMIKLVLAKCDPEARELLGVGHGA